MWDDWLAAFMMTSILLNPQLIVYSIALGVPALVIRILSCFLCGVAAGAFLVCGSLGPPALNKALGNPVTRFFAAISYNFYMWHQFIAVRLKEAHIPAYVSESPNQAAEQPWMTQYTWLCFAAAIAAAALFTYLWERPIYRMGLKKQTKQKTETSRV